MNAMQADEMHYRENLAPNLRKLMQFNAINTPRSSELFWCGASQAAMRLLTEYLLRKLGRVLHSNATAEQIAVHAVVSNAA